MEPLNFTNVLSNEPVTNLLLTYLSYTDTASLSVAVENTNISIQVDKDDLYRCAIKCIAVNDGNSLSLIYPKLTARQNIELLFDACRLYKRACILVLRKYVNKVYNRITPIMHSCLFNVYDSVALLLKLGADVNCSVTNKSPLLFAISNRASVPIVRLLLDNNALINHVSCNTTALCYACVTDDIDMASLLLSYGANVDIQDCDGNTPLILALIYKNTDMVSLLLANGADMRLKNKQNYSAAGIAYTCTRMTNLIINESLNRKLGSRIY